MPVHSLFGKGRFFDCGADIEHIDVIGDRLIIITKRGAIALTFEEMDQIASGLRQVREEGAGEGEGR